MDWLSFDVFDKIWTQFGLYKRFLAGSQHSRAQHHTHHRNESKGRKSQEQDAPIGPSAEYAKESKVLEAPVLELVYYADVAGFVPPRSEQTAHDADPFDIGNGDFPPEWGIDLVVRSGRIRYGPWADRQRCVHEVVLWSRCSWLAYC